MELLQSVHFHVSTVGAGAVVGWSGDEVFFGDFLLDAMKHSGFGDDDDVLSRGVTAEIDHFFGRANFIGEKANCFGALRMCDDDGVGIVIFDFLDGFTGELHVDVTISLPEIHLTAGLFNDPLAEVLIGDEENGPVLWGLIGDTRSVSGSADNVAERLDASRAVDVCDDVIILFGVFLEEFL